MRATRTVTAAHRDFAPEFDITTALGHSYPRLKCPIRDPLHACRHRRARLERRQAEAKARRKREWHPKVVSPDRAERRILGLFRHAVVKRAEKLDEGRMRELIGAANSSLPGPFGFSATSRERRGARSLSLESRE